MEHRINDTKLGLISDIDLSILLFFVSGLLIMHFSRMFKNETGQIPNEYRSLN